MTFEQRKYSVLSAWTATIAVVGCVLTIERPALWIYVAALAMIPAAVGNELWSAPEPTMSQLIERYRR